MTSSSKNEPLTREQLIQAQFDWCKNHDCPMFASSAGRCWACSRDIVDPSWATGLVTGCKFCHRSFVD